MEMARGSVPNFLSNSQQFLRKFGDRIIEASKDIQAPQKFISDVSKVFSANLKQAPWGAYTSDVGKTSTTPQGTTRSYETPIADASKTARNVGGVGTEFIAGETQRKYGYGSNPYRLQSQIGQKVASKLEDMGNATGLSPAAAATIAFGVPALYNTLTEKQGPITQGLRPKGYKAVAPVSKEEDPTGKTPRSLVEEAGTRFFGGQTSQMLPYKEFIKERPDVMPSTIADYRRYVNRKPEAGKRIDVDPEKQTFTAFGGAIKGTARGLNDPEIRFKGVPFTASATLGTAAGVATVAAGVKKLNPYMQDIYKQEKQVNVEKLKVDDYKRGYGADSGMTKIAEDKLKSAEQMLENSKQVRYDYDLSPAAQKFQKLGSLKEPALLLGGTLAAVGTAAVAKKLFQKAEQERIKKEDPLQYKKYKRGDYTREQ
tara:strand:+ start:1572 stop:2852 length:1281 start_codon:yes stop_codon:yes gene_type:complete